MKNNEAALDQLSGCASTRTFHDPCMPSRLVVNARNRHGDGQV
jgi:hypothetical protein